MGPLKYRYQSSPEWVKHNSKHIKSKCTILQGKNIDWNWPVWNEFFVGQAYEKTCIHGFLFWNNAVKNIKIPKEYE